MALRMHDQERLWNPQGSPRPQTRWCLPMCGCSRKPSNPLLRMWCWTFIRTWWGKLVMGKLGACWQLGRPRMVTIHSKASVQMDKAVLKRRMTPEQDRTPHPMPSSQGLWLCMQVGNATSGRGLSTHGAVHILWEWICV